MIGDTRRMHRAEALRQKAARIGQWSINASSEGNDPVALLVPIALLVSVAQGGD